MRGKSFGTVASPVRQLGRSQGGDFKLIASETISGAGNFTRSAPPGARLLVGRQTGAGASGSIGSGTNSNVGGRQGDWAEFNVLVTDATAISGTNGTGGASVQGSTAASTAGGDSSLTADGTQICLAKGGPGGAILNNTPVAAGISYGRCVLGRVAYTLGTPTNNPSGPAGGDTSTSPDGGTGGTGSNNAANGTAGGPGAGGGGVYNNTSSTRRSGAGGDGITTLFWYGVA